VWGAKISVLPGNRRFLGRAPSFRRTRGRGLAKARRTWLAWEGAKQPLGEWVFLAVLFSW